jgi:hypothetical protein
MMNTAKSMIVNCTALIAIAVCGSAASAQFFRPNSATATSEFSASYDIGNAIDGSGLPANFGPNDAHATYTTNNHWTTRANQTIGQSATFTFAAARPVGGFYMWNHRSNGIASNSFYAVTRFDLVFRDGPGGTGTVLQSLNGLTALGNIAAAQTFAFPVVANVRSVQFIVRATANNNSSPYTGLAEVGFDECVSTIVRQPGNVQSCPGGTAEISVDAIGSGSIAYQWRKNGTPINPAENPSATTATLVLPNASAADEASYDVVLTLSCRSITSNAATLVICPSDYNCDGTTDFFDYLDFVADFSNEAPRADFNGDNVIDFFDYLDFVATLDSGCL